MKAWHSWALLLSLGSIWGLHFIDGAEAQSVGLLFQERRPHKVVSGFKPMLETMTEPVTFGGRTNERTATTLVIATDETCPFCNEEIGNWKSLLDSVSWTPDISLTIVSLSGSSQSSQLLSHIDGRVSSYRVLVPRDPLRFPIDSGIASVPMTLVLDHEGAVRALVNRLDSTSIAQLVRTLTHLSVDSHNGEAK
jgi:hypothetical protein